MIFADKIIDLRKKNGWSQEKLAEELGVSRQTVSKWEGAQSVPDFNRVIQISELFHVSTDYLLKDSIDIPETYALSQDTKPWKEEIRKVSMEEANLFLETRDVAAAKISIGVMMCILSPVVLILLVQLQETGNIPLTEDQAAGLGLLCLFLLIAGAVALFIIQSLKLNPFEYLENELIETEYGVDGMVKTRRAHYTNLHTKWLTTGIALCVLSPVPLFICEIIGENSITEVLAVAAFLSLVAVGVMMIVRCSILWDSFDILLENGDYTRKNKRENQKNKNISALYWGIVTAIYLGYSFHTFNWHKSWIIWPIAGVSYGILCVILRMMRKEI